VLNVEPRVVGMEREEREEREREKERKKEDFLPITHHH